MSGRGLPLSDELHGQVLADLSDTQEPAPAAGNGVHVDGIQTEGTMPSLSQSISVLYG